MIRNSYVPLASSSSAFVRKQTSLLTQIIEFRGEVAARIRIFDIANIPKSEGPTIVKSYPTVTKWSEAASAYATLWADFDQGMRAGVT